MPYLFDYIGRGGGIRTPDPLLPKQMRYQTALRPDIWPITATEVASTYVHCIVRTRWSVVFPAYRVLGGTVTDGTIAEEIVAAIVQRQNA